MPVIQKRLKKENDYHTKHCSSSTVATSGNCLSENCQRCEQLRSIGCRAVRPPRLISNNVIEQKKTITISGLSGESGQINSRNHTLLGNVTYTLIWLLSAPPYHVLDIDINPDLFIDCDDDLLEIYDEDKRVRGYTSKRNCPKNYTEEEQSYTYRSGDSSLVIIYRRNRRVGSPWKNDGFQVCCSTFRQV